MNALTGEDAEALRRAAESEAQHNSYVFTKRYRELL